jgi:hypothetical protein
MSDRLSAPKFAAHLSTWVVAELTPELSQKATSARDPNSPGAPGGDQ